jgi:hypothetical protein
MQSAALLRHWPDFGRKTMNAPTVVKTDYCPHFGDMVLRLSDGSACVVYAEEVQDIIREITQGPVLTWLDAIYAQIESEGGAPCA